MSSLEIFESSNVGEIRWSIHLINDEGVTILRNVSPMSKGVVLSTAKALKNKGADAPFLGETLEGKDRPYWFAEKATDGWLLGFNLINGTLFDLFLKPEDRTSDIKVVENALQVVKSNLMKVEIKWNPPEADPAYTQKESDLTPTKGHPGS